MKKNTFWVRKITRKRDRDNYTTYYISLPIEWAETHLMNISLATIRPINNGSLEISVIRDFGVSMNDNVLKHKLQDGKESEDRYCYWSFPRELPEGVDIDSRMWVANHGRWIGYFTVFDIRYKDEVSSLLGKGEVLFYSESFVRVDGGERKPFMGYTFNVPPRSD
jgi:hypothetical protein